jgi:hypothetical protein
MDGTDLGRINDTEPGTWNLDSDGPFRIAGADGVLPFNGDIDEVRLWGIARKSPLGSDKDLILDGKDPNLLGYWRFEEGSGELTYSAATATPTCTGTIHNATWIHPGAPVH